MSYDEISDFPCEELQLIANELGIDIANLLCEKLKGLQFVIPQKWKENDLIFQIIGKGTADKLSKSFSGMSLYIPKNTSINFVQKKIRELYDGTNAKHIALLLAVSEKTVFKYINITPAKKEEKGLFD